MQRSDMPILLLRVTSAIILLVIAGVYAGRRDWVPAALFSVISAVVFTLAAGLLRKNQKRP